MTRERLLVLLLLLAAAGAVAFLLLGGDERSDRVTWPAASTAGNASAPCPAAGEDAARERAAGPAQGRETLKPDAKVPSTPQLRGTVVVVDPEGREHATEDGEVTLHTWRGSSGVGVAAKVTAGRFSLPLPQCDTLSVEELRLGGRLAAIDPERVPLPADGVLALRAHWPAPATLKVVADRDGRELDRVVILDATLRSCVGLLHPGVDADAAPIAGDASSPILLPERVHTRSYWVRSPGYAWRRTRVDHTAGGEHVVRLEAGGALEIHLTGHHVESEAFVRLRKRPVPERTRSRPDAEVAPPAAGAILLEALEPGDYRATAEIGSWIRRTVVLGSGDVTVEPGATTSVTIQLAEPPPVPEPVPLRGILELAPEWKALEPDLRLEPLEGEPSALADSPGRRLECRRVEGKLRWDAGEVLPGRYAVVLDDPPFSTVLDVGPGGTEDARIVVPPPGDVVVRMTDDTGRLVPVDGVELERLSFPAQTGGWSGSETPMEAGQVGVFRARVAAGRFRLSISAFSDYVLSPSAGGELEIHAGHNEITVPVTRPSGIEIELPDLAGTFQVVQCEIDVRALDGDGEARLWRYGRSSQTFVVTEPGPYEVKVVVPPAPFKRAAPRVVEVRRGQIAEVTVDLERE